MHQALHILRGLMAFSILVFHYQKWTTDFWDASSIFGILGVYGVSIFFVLSGLVLTLSCKKNTSLAKPDTIQYWIVFFKKRFWRIFPLLWFATLATLVLDEFEWSKTDIFLNFTGFFGFIKPAADIATGAWSIGCELVYYALFPLVFIFFQRFSPKKALFLLAITAKIGFFYAFFILETNLDIKAQWAFYVQPFNHLFFFVSGMAIAFFSKNDKTRVGGVFTFSLALFLGFVCMFIYFYTANIQNPSDLIAGTNRVLLSALSIFLCWLAYKIPNQIETNWLLEICIWLGTISYSLYLLHPIVYRVVRAFFEKTMDNTYTPWHIAATALPLSLLCSHFTYTYIEKYFVNWGK